MKSRSYSRWATLLFLALWLMLAHNNLHAQFVFGLKAGAGQSSLNVEHYSSSPKFSFLAGAMLNVYAVEVGRLGVALQPELLFNRKGVVFSPSTPKAESSLNVSLNYLEVPIAIHVMFNIKGVYPYIAVAPYASFLLYKNEGLNGKVSERENFASLDYQDFDAGLKLGAGVETSYFQLSGQYVYGLTDVVGESKNNKYRNWEVTVGYFFLR